MSTTKAVLPILLVKEIQDLYIRQNFLNLYNYFQTQNQLLNFNFFELVISAATTSVKTLAHGLGVTPKDILVTQVTGTGSVQFLYGSFTSTTISYTATGPCRVRFFVGTYFADTSLVAAQSFDVETLTASPESSGDSVVVAPSTNYTMTGLESLVLASAPSTQGMSVTLPPMVNGQIVRMEKSDASSNAVNILCSSQAQIYPLGVTSLSLKTRGESVELIGDGTNWILNKHYLPGFTGTGAYTSFTIKNGIIVAAS